MEGQTLSMAGRETLVKCVLTSQPIYHLTVFPLQKWLLKQIDRVRRSFLWNGEELEKVSGAHCLVNWATVCTPKDLGGLGILDLDRFARALRLRWQWHIWKSADRPWTKLDILWDSTNRELFNSSTIVTVGRGDRASFWLSSWVNGRAPKSLAPLLFQKARRKNILVQKAMQRNKWVQHISPLSNLEELRQYLLLWEELGAVVRDENMTDDIKWRWTQYGQYTTQSAYKIQFMGRQKKISFRNIWTAKTEPKIKIFAWILLQYKILTANNLAKRGWPHDPQCKLCNSGLETPSHLCLECNYTREVWNKLMSWMGHHDPQTTPPRTLHGWWKRMRRLAARSNRRAFKGLILHFWWNIWKERNIRVFQNTSKGIDEVATLIRTEVELFHAATFLLDLLLLLFRLRAGSCAFLAGFLSLLELFLFLFCTYLFIFLLIKFMTTVLPFLSKKIITSRSKIIPCYNFDNKTSIAHLFILCF
jgi:hypothetical protein